MVPEVRTFPPTGYVPLVGFARIAANAVPLPVARFTTQELIAVGAAAFAVGVLVADGPPEDPTEDDDDLGDDE